MSQEESPPIAGGSGLFDGFEGYRTPQPGDYKEIATSGLIALDANVLLNLYRYNEATRNDLMSLMELVSARLWVPHQAMEEFWRNRETAANGAWASTQEAIEALEKARRATEAAMSMWAKKTALADDPRDEVLGELGPALDRAVRSLNAQAEKDRVKGAQDTALDPIVTRLARILEGRVGPPLPDEDYATALEEAERRIQAKLPPGYRSGYKDNAYRADDYLIWEQLLRAAANAGCDALFVTGDTKDDWWRRNRGRALGPRPELVEEFRRRTGRMLFMLQPQEFLRDIGSAINANISPTSAVEVERVDHLLKATPETNERSVIQARLDAAMQRVYEVAEDFVSGT
ncbi:hypothetical protein UO65_3767 [Actinokineospora spheciospongiae]|uniref:PIN like domain-containing protein n=1 Tax=Actinokineospora spheciospongiae TaxID=909613 RepID=W7IKS8_9PSEU|nr:PIN domain-containing protein [Actinokineospora spheciospongiae]EWC60948.1 hypothetical protein UO65_3767 [Actinokineospora spheciospongiae]PWW62331.1 hypothetical protein DFQ13_105141 [Actinokineospora spheciospongiae]